MIIPEEIVGCRQIWDICEQNGPVFKPHTYARVFTDRIGRFENKMVLNSSLNSTKVFADRKGSFVNKMAPFTNLISTRVFAERIGTFGKKVVPYSNFSFTGVFADRKWSL